MAATYPRRLSLRRRGTRFPVRQQARAPRLLQRAGFEWAWRLIANPRRLSLRYARCAALLADLMLLQPLQRRLTGARPRRSRIRPYREFADVSLMSHAPDGPARLQTRRHRDPCSSHPLASSERFFSPFRRRRRMRRSAPRRRHQSHVRRAQHRFSARCSDRSAKHQSAEPRTLRSTTFRFALGALRHLRRIRAALRGSRLRRSAKVRIRTAAKAARASDRADDPRRRLERAKDGQYHQELLVFASNQ